LKLDCFVETLVEPKINSYSLLIPCSMPTSLDETLKILVLPRSSGSFKTIVFVARALVVRARESVNSIFSLTFSLPAPLA
jgi:hypothetical protein